MCPAYSEQLSVHLTWFKGFSHRLHPLQNMYNFIWTLISKTWPRFIRISSILQSFACSAHLSLWVFIWPWGGDRSLSSPFWKLPGMTSTVCVPWILVSATDWPHTKSWDIFRTLISKTWPRIIRSKMLESVTFQLRDHMHSLLSAQLLKSYGHFSDLVVEIAQSHRRAGALG